MRCDLCGDKRCRDEEPCVVRNSIELYSDPHEKMMMQTAAVVESEFYGDLNRIEEVVEFAARCAVSRNPIWELRQATGWGRSAATL